jgi:regulation of enolase protein 1 (concanavalin A-like superfamily)
LDFGNLASEASHNFEPGYNISQMPLLGNGTVGASQSQTYREPTGTQELVFTMAVDPNRQNYFTVRLWGNDAPGTNIYLSGNSEPLEEGMGNIEYPNRFLYLTINIPISMTTGKSSLALDLTFGGTSSSYYRPIYSAYTHTDPYFVPDSADPTGTKPTQTGQATLDTLTETEANNILLANRQSIYNSGGYFDTILARQAIVLDGLGGWSAPTGAPKEVAGLDMFTNLSSWMAANPSASNDTWRNRIANQTSGSGYTAFPSELLSVLTATYLLDSLKNSGGTVIYAAPHYHDSSLITRVVAAIDGASYEQDSDGGFIQQGSEWTGLCSTARTTGSYIGTTARKSTAHGGGDLQGVGTYALGWSIIQLLNDSTAAPILQSYLAQSYDADFNSGSMMRAYAWERTLDNAIAFYQTATGGTVSQNMFQELAMYADTIALNKLQALYPNSSYTTSYTTSLNYVKELMGLIPNTHMRGVGFDVSSPYAPSPYTNYGLTQKGLGEAHGTLSSGYDGGGYGQLVTWLAIDVAQLTAWDANIDTATRDAIRGMANNTVNAFDQFISPLERATVNGNGVLTSDIFSMGEETYITYRDVKNLNFEASRFNLNAQFLASDPNGVLNNAYTLRAAYLNTQYNLTPSTTANSGHGDPGGCLNYIRDLAAYERTVKSLIGVNPTALTELPAEPGQPDYAWADVQAGAVAVINHGERLYVNADWRNYDCNNNTFIGLVPSQLARIHYTTDTIERGAMIVMPYNSSTVQGDGNYTSTNYNGAKVVRYGDYLIVLNQSTSAYSAKLPVGVGLVENLVTGNLYSMSTSTTLTTVSVAAGQYAIFWLAASNVISSLNPGADVGVVGTAGSDSYLNGVYTVKGAGADIGGTADAFRFVSTSYSGDVSVMALISSQTAGNNAAEAGVMIRDGSASDASFAAVVRTPGNGLMFEWRSSTGGTMAWAAAPTPLTAVWVRITRSGNNLAGYYSTDGITWAQIGTPQTLSLSSSALVGLAVSSHNTSALSTAVFNNLWIASGTAPIVATPAAASANPVTGTTVNLSVLGADNGGESALTYTWYLLGSPPHPVTYSANGINAAKNTTVTFATDGVYNFRVIIKDASGFIATSDVSVTVNQTLTGVSVTPSTVSLYNNQTQQFTSFVVDQFSAPMAEQPTFTWSIVSGVGTVDSFGLYTAPASGSGSASVRATSGSLYGSASVIVSTTTAVGIFSNTQAIGSYSPTGSASYSSGAYTVSSAGSDIWDIGDQFRYVYMPLTGDGTIIARVVSESNTNTWAKAGVMFRNTLDVNSAYAMIFVTPTTTNGVSFQYRSSAGSSAANNGAYTGVTAPYWVRLTRTGNSFTAERSPDGTTWTQVGTNQTISMNQTIYVGLEVCSHAAGSLMTATFDNVSVAEIRNVANGGTASASPEGSGSETSLKAFDGSTTTKWYESSSPTTWLQYDLGAGISWAVGRYDISSANDVPQRDPKDWQFQASNDGTTWTTLDTRTAQTFAARYQTNQYTITNTTAYRYYRLNITANSGGSGYGVQLSEMALIVFSAPGTPQGTPTVATPAAASPATVTGTTTNLTVLGADSDGGESNLTYTWTLVGSVLGNVTFNRNGTNAAKNATATFTKAGSYNFKVTIMDTGGLSVTSSVSATVNQTFTSIALSPTTPSISPLGTQQFTAIAKDQFGNPMAPQPSFTWSIYSGSGLINSSTGLYTASATGASATVRATSGSINGSTTVSIVNQSPLLAASSYPNVANAVVGQGTALSVLGVDDAGESNLIYTWSVLDTPPAPVTFGANGNNTAKNTTAVFTKAGTYNLQVTITDAGGLVTTIAFSIGVSSTIAGRNIFYNNSKFDAHTGFASGDPAINDYDDSAIAADKQALMPGQTATFNNYTSYNRGIDGIMVDIAGLANPGGINAADFQFQVGNGSGWTAAPAPSNILVRQGKGPGGSDRVTITWDDNAIQNQWLQVTVLADADTGLSATDVFYFGNAIGESGDNPANALVDSQDELGSRTHKTGFTAAAIDNHFDYNRDGRVNATDDLIARHNPSGSAPLQLIAAPVGAPPASGDALQPLSVVVEIATSQSATASADIAASQSVALPAADIATLQPAALLEDKAISQPALTAVEITSLQPVPLSPAAAIATSWAEIVPASAISMPAQSPFSSLPRSSVAAQFPGVLHPQDMARNLNPFSTSRDAGALDQWIPTPERGIQILTLEHGNLTSRPALSQDRLHDAVFARLIARISLTQEDGLPDASPAPADIETFLNDCLPLKSGKSFAHAIDTVLAVAHHKND